MRVGSIQLGMPGDAVVGVVAEVAEFSNGMIVVYWLELERVSMFMDEESLQNDLLAGHVLAWSV